VGGGEGLRVQVGVLCVHAAKGARSWVPPRAWKRCAPQRTSKSMFRPNSDGAGPAEDGAQLLAQELRWPAPKSALAASVLAHAARHGRDHDAHRRSRCQHPPAARHGARRHLRRCGHGHQRGCRPARGCKLQPNPRLPPQARAD